MANFALTVMNRRTQDGAVADFNHLACLIAKAKIRPRSVAGSLSEAPVRQDPREALASQLRAKHQQPSDDFFGSQCGTTYKKEKITMSDWRKR